MYVCINTYIRMHIQTGYVLLKVIAMYVIMYILGHKQMLEHSNVRSFV